MSQPQDSFFVDAMYWVNGERKIKNMGQTSKSCLTFQKDIKEFRQWRTNKKNDASDKNIRFICFSWVILFGTTCTWSAQDSHWKTRSCRQNGNKISFSSLFLLNLRKYEIEYTNFFYRQMNVYRNIKVASTVTSFDLRSRKKTFVASSVDSSVETSREKMKKKFIFCSV